ncbi:MAG: threonine--tRNA ligase [Phycisphaerae bacterium]|nr:threonine--tRNA ligase [Phycisphaerae bacterium]
MLRIKLPDGKVLEMPDGSTPADVAARIGPGLARAAINARISMAGGPPRHIDVATPIPADCELSIITLKGDDADAMRILRHSTAHVMAEAICRLFPETRLVYGPPVENGYYYDIDLPRRLTPDDFPAIEAEMARIVKEDRPFTRYELPRAAAMKKLAAEGNPYKIDNAERAEGDVLSFYVTGPEPGKYWEDLCMGTHLPSTGRIGAFKVLNVAGAFWHGDATKQQLQRVYGTAFPSKKELDAYLTQLEQARERDHRRIGQELGLFTIDPLVGSGMVLWKPKGAVIRLLLEEHLRGLLRQAGYQPVFSPHVGRLELFRTSGHFPYYRDSQFPPLYESDTARILNELWIAVLERGDAKSISTIEEQLLEELRAANPGLWQTLVGDPQAPEARRLNPAPGHQQHNLAVIREHLRVEDGFLLKPMNCPLHVRIYASEPRSYRDLPVRLAEFGTVYRYEQSGELSGMTRVRGFTQDDAHIFCTPEQLQDELAGCLKLTRYVLEVLGLYDYRVRIGLHDPADPKFIKNPEGWAMAESAVRHAAEQSGISATEEVGEAAFYGPKIDFLVKDCIGREWQLGTVQADYNLPARFELEYIGSDNRPHRPIMVHRAPFGSMERFIGILIEHFAGAFPVWLAPVQAVIASISDRSADYARRVTAQLRDAGFRAEVDDSPDKIGPKKHRARSMKIPYIVVVGEQECSRGTLNVNDRDGRCIGDLSVAAFIDRLRVESRPKRVTTRASAAVE